MVYSYKSQQAERAEVGYLVSASPDRVYQWLRDHHRDPDKGIYGEPLGLRDDDGRRLVEYLLSRRKDKLIDYGLARYGYSRRAIQNAYDRGDVSTKYAALANSRGGVALRQAFDVLSEGKYNAVGAMLQNKWLAGDYIEALLKRKGKFAELSDDRFLAAVHALHGHPRLKRPYESLYLHGYDEYRYELPTRAAWELAATVPANQAWAAALWNLYSSIRRPRSFDNLNATLARWDIDAPLKEEDKGKWHSRSYSFFVRSYLNDFRQPDESLLNSEDVACRNSFYRRFDPLRFPDWPSFLERDGEEFTEAALNNEGLWRVPQERQRLSRVCWDTPDPRSNLDMPNSFRSHEQRQRERHPEWFDEIDDEEDEVQSQEGSAARQLVPEDESPTSVTEQVNAVGDTVKRLASLLVRQRRKMATSSRSVVEQLEAITQKLARLDVLQEAQRTRQLLQLHKFLRFLLLPVSVLELLILFAMAAAAGFFVRAYLPDLNVLLLILIAWVATELAGFIAALLVFAPIRALVRWAVFWFVDPVPAYGNDATEAKATILEGPGRVLLAKMNNDIGNWTLDDTERYVALANWRQRWLFPYRQRVVHLVYGLQQMLEEKGKQPKDLDVSEITSLVNSFPGQKLSGFEKVVVNPAAFVSALLFAIAAAVVLAMHK